MDQSRAVEAGAGQKVLMTFTLIRQFSLLNAIFFFHSFLQFTTISQNASEIFYQISVAGNPHGGFLCSKNWHLVSNIFGIVNLIRRNWRGKKSPSLITALSFLGSWWALGWRCSQQEMSLSGWWPDVLRAMALETRWGSCTMPLRAPTLPAGGCSCACRTGRCRSWGLPGWISHILCPAWTALGTCRTQRHMVQRHSRGQPIRFSWLQFHCTCLTRLRCLCWAAPFLQQWPRCGRVWWWSQSNVRCWVRSLLWWLRLTPEAKECKRNLHQGQFFKLLYHLENKVHTKQSKGVQNSSIILSGQSSFSCPQLDFVAQLSWFIISCLQ